MADHFEKLCSFRFLKSLQVEKYKSKRTGVTLCFVDVPGPLVNGFFTLATEAHDDDGLPHTLEHLVFMGSENYPYKGLLDLFANRCLAQGTNAWTDTDHTCYTMTTAGSEGFLNLLPIYLDHILYPTLTESAYLTEVHHINGEGEDAGVVYSEMQARENTGESRTHLTFLRNMYPGICGYKSETGGIMENLRTSCSHKKVCDYHHQFYRPENLCLLITGQVKPEDVFERMKSFEEKILSNDKRPTHVRPWQSPVPNLPESKITKIQFPSDDEETGQALIGYRGPKATDDYSIEAIKVIMTYLTDSPVATLQQILVECPEPYCSDVSFDFIENSEGCLYITAENVPTEKLDDVIPRITEAIQDIVKGKVELDMKRMSAVIHREILDAMDKIEDKPHESFAGFCIGDFLYSTQPNQLLDKVDTIRHLKDLAQQSQDFWIKFLDKYFVNATSITVIGEPSQKLMAEMSKIEEDRVKQQQERLGPNGLKERGERLERANKENGIEPPSELVSSLPIPSISSINFHDVKTASNLGNISDDVIISKFPVNNIPYSFQLDHISSLFIEITVLLDTSVLPDDLKDYLSLYIAVILESPVLRNGVVISHEDIVAQLTQDTLDYGTSLGLNGRRFSPGKFPQLAVLRFKIETEKYSVAIELLRDLLYNVQFTVERIKVVAKKMIKEVTQMKRQGRTIVNALIKDNTFSSESPYRSCNFIHQQQFLNKILKEVKNNPDKIISDLSNLREKLTDHKNLRVHVTTNVNNLPANAHNIWESNFIPGIPAAAAKQMVDLQHVSVYLRQDDIQSKIIGVGSVESSFLIQCCPGIHSFTHPDFAPIMVFMECLIALEGPMWRQIRGLGLSYHYSMFCDPGQGLIYFILFKASHLAKAYEKADEIMSDYLSGKVPFEAVQLESAISSVIFEIIGQEESVGDAAFENLLSGLRNVGKDFNKLLLEKISKVSLEDLRRVGKKYFTKLFSVAQSNCAVCCHPSKVDEIQTSFQKFGRELIVVSSLDEEMK
ncbi:uncharacterized protein C05D11.1-like [Dendronephthya gigantea]|uniref:uncharacterized protein C05D11.1-like n=1 Tax=Dendronephthya gigantea TaxID=151771 RepID=UPI00106BF43B|nr:uncharacterized protein C05D11.1-like [Dendronephthya gigantea]